MRKLEEIEADPTNEERAEAAKKALESQDKYYCRDTWPESVEESIIDLVADLFHLAHRQGTHRDDIIRAANLHFEAEIEEAGEALLPSGILP